ncbi:MAG TPA: YciI family protein [Cyclobacteriaceae bacterium]
MQKFMLIVREDLKRLRTITDEERFSNIPPVLEWIKSIAESGNYVGGEPLAVTGRYVSRAGVQSDGPFIEAKERIAGYDIILAENIEQAVSIAQTCPLVMAGVAIREVRPIVGADSLAIMKSNK